MTQQTGNPQHETMQRPDDHRLIRIKVLTPRGLWSDEEPKDATKRPDYRPSTKIEQVIADARSVFGFVENDSKYTLLRGREILDPHRTLVSYEICDGTLLVLSVQGGNA